MLNPSSYEIPLRSMYTLNCQTLALMSTGGFKESSAFATNPAPAMHNPNDPMADAASQFKAQLISHISKSPHQSPLPVGFMLSFVRRTFAPNLEYVDFPQAITALDYLKNLNRRRHSEAKAALESLAIKLDPASPYLRICPSQKEELQLTYPGVVHWVDSICKRDRTAYHLFMNVYVSLRRWTLLNEMWQEPLNKGNCIAMLNTLFPPTISNSKPSNSSNGELEPDQLARQREWFFEYIKKIERTGKVGLEYVLKSGARPGDETAWPMVHESLKKYLDLAAEMIHDCEDVKGRAEIKGRDCLETELRNSKTHKRNADSGVSFTSSLNDSSVSSSNDSRAATPLDKSRSPTPESKHGKSTLERISHQLRKMRSRPDISSGGGGNKEPGKVKTLTKKKSFTALVSGRSASSSSVHAYFDVDEMNRKKMIWEANERKKAAALQAAETRGATSKQLYDE